ncbi:outer membrane lipoprotein chaperone LolA [Kineobactrum salinum]|uniref:Outer-membrane lipoprotein carrier protein n=1 Tax=Kineobactrum salinum TaxID=2708301 RepID=A0A6C0U3P8_9GAMM|nr:outer membrane lipoprotein chaperone LolA [Kineobactrum salinum]
MDELLTALEAIDQLQGEFQQIQYDQDDRPAGKASGQFKLLRPGYFAWEISSPDSQLIIANREYLWHFDRDLETVTRRPVADTEAMTPLQVLGGDASALRRDYTVERDQRDRFVLIPRDGDPGFLRLALELDGALIRGMEVLDNLRQRVVIEFSALDPTPGLSAADFDFTPPPDADLFYHEQ